MDESPRLFCVNHGFKCFWTIREFILCKSNRGLQLKSPKFKVQILHCSEWYIEIVIHENNFGVYLCKCEGVTFDNPVNYSIHLLTGNGWQKKGEDYDLFRRDDEGNGEDNLMYDSLTNETLTLFVHLWNGSTKWQEDQCVMTSAMVDEDEIHHYPFKKFPIITERDLLEDTYHLNSSSRVKKVIISESMAANEFSHLSSLLRELKDVFQSREARDFADSLRTLKSTKSDKGTQTDALDNFSELNNVDLLYSLLKEKKISYVFLKTEEKEFVAHKALLCAQSSVFKAMFEENGSNSIMIKDIDHETISNLLKFLHLEPLEDLKWNSAVELFFAADKYQIEELKSKCISAFKMGLTEENVYDAYILVGLHQENELMQSVLEYFCENSEKVFSSSQLKCLIQTNPELVSKIMCQLTKKYANCKN